MAPQKGYSVQSSRKEIGRQIAKKEIKVNYIMKFLICSESLIVIALF